MTVVAVNNHRDSRIEAARAHVDLDAQAKAVDRLHGLEDLYDAIEVLESPQLGFISMAEKEIAKREKAEQVMEHRLKQARFGSVDDFNDAVGRLRTVVKRQAVLLGLSRFRESERVLSRETARYGAKSTVIQLATELSKLPRPVDPLAPEALKLRDAYPLLRDPVTFKGATESKYPEFLRELLLQNVGAQLRNVEKCREAIKENPEIVFKFDLLIDDTLQQMGLEQTSVQWRAIKDGRAAPRDIKREALELILNLVAVVLSFVSGPLGWVGYVAGGVGYGFMLDGINTRQRERAIVTAASHSGKRIATTPKQASDTLDAVGIVAGALPLGNVPKSKAAAAAEAAARAEQESIALAQRESTVVADDAATAGNSTTPAPQATQPVAAPVDPPPTRATPAPAVREAAAAGERPAGRPTPEAPASPRAQTEATPASAPKLPASSASRSRRFVRNASLAAIIRGAEASNVTPRFAAGRSASSARPVASVVESSSARATPTAALQEPTLTGKGLTARAAPDAPVSPRIQNEVSPAPITASTPPAVSGPPVSSTRSWLGRQFRRIATRFSQTRSAEWRLLISLQGLPRADQRAPLNRKRPGASSPTPAQKGS